MSNNKSNSPWNDGELLFLKQNYQTMTHDEIAKRIGRTKTAVDIKLSKLGLKKSKYHYNCNFFNIINSEEKAYWLGFIFADGYVHFNTDVRNYELGIELQASDYLHLKKFNKSLNGNVDVKFRERDIYWENQGYTRSYKTCLIRFYSRTLIEPLLKYNIANGKSDTLDFPDIPLEYYSPFIRGFFDGDGCICKDSIHKRMVHLDFTSVSYNILEKIRTILYNNGIYSYIYQEKAYDNYSKKCGKNGMRNTYRLCIKGVTNTYNMIRYLYDDATIFLDRKYYYANELVDKYNLNERSLPPRLVIDESNRERNGNAEMQTRLEGHI